MPTTHRLVTASFTALAGAIVMVAIIRSALSHDTMLVLGAAAGAFLSGLVFADFFGRQGPVGHLTAAAAAILTTLVGAATVGFGIGLSDGVPLQGAAFAALFVPVAVATTPQALLIWPASMSTVHLIMLWVRHS